MLYKLEQPYVTNWGSFVLLQIRVNLVTTYSTPVIANRDSCYRVDQNSLKIVADITN